MSCHALDSQWRRWVFVAPVIGGALIRNLTMGDTELQTDPLDLHLPVGAIALAAVAVRWGRRRRKP